MLHRLVFLLNHANTLQNVLKMIKLRFDFRLKQVRPWSHWKEKGKNYKLPLSRHFLKFKMSFLVKLSHRIFPLFNRFSIFDKNVNLSKTNPEAKRIFFLVFPSLNTSIFSTYPKIASTLRPFEGPRLKKSPFQIQKFNFLKRKPTPKTEKFSNSFHNGELKSFTQKPQGKR